jgi:hypothetical protein
LFKLLKVIKQFLCSLKKFGGAYSRRVVRPSFSPFVCTYVPNSCLAHNLVIKSQILQLFYRNDHHIETTCRTQHLGRYLEGQGHNMTLQQNSVHPITSLFEVGFYNYFTEMITILSWPVACNIWVTTLKIKVTAWPCSKIVCGPLLLYLKSDFKTISQKRSTYWDYVLRATFWSLPWRSRSQHDLAAKWCAAHNFFIWSRILKLFHRSDHHNKPS